MPSRLLVASVVGTALALSQVLVGAQDTGGVIRGRIVAADTGRPLRRARITATRQSGSENRTTNTNADGTYEIKDLPEGRYRISVVRNGYLPLQYGQHHPLEQPKLLEVNSHGVFDHVDFSLPKMSLYSTSI